MNTQDQYPPLAPLMPLLNDPEVVGIMVDGPEQVYVERSGEFEDVPTPFRDEAHLMEFIAAILAPMGKMVNESNPIMDTRLPDGSRVNVVLPPISLTGPVLTIRKFRTGLLTSEDLLRFGSWNEDMVTFLQACVQARLNIAVTGGTGSGKTTVLNLVAGMIPEEERIVVVQSAAELELPQKRVITLETRPPNLEGRGEVSAQDLMANALKMRPDRIILCEVMGGNEALTLFEASNRGHDGNLLTIHANSPRDVLFRLESAISAGNPSIPLLNVRQIIASAIDIITYQERLRDGSRKVTKVAEVQGMQGDAIVLQDIFEFRQTGFEEGRIQGHFSATGHIPKALRRIRDAGIDLPLGLFTLARPTPPSPPSGRPTPPRPPSAVPPPPPPEQP